MNNKSFLSALKDNLAKSGVSIEIAGQDMIVVPPTAGQLRDHLIASEKHAKEELREKETELRGRKISSEERKELRNAFKALGAPDQGFETEYDRDLITRKMHHYSKLIISDAVRHPDGSKTWETESERFEIAGLIMSTPGAEELVRSALEEAQKKSLTKDQ